VVDDDNDILDLLQYNLEREGFKVRTINNSEKALEVLTKFKPELIILDIMMPGINGIELCKIIRSHPQYADTCIFFLTAKTESYYREAALETGGDDFIEKIIGLRALINKVVTVLKRRFIIRKRDSEVVCGSMSINRKSGIVSVDQDKIGLTRPELELLYFFAQNPRKVISTENLLSNVWGLDLYSMTSSIELHLTNLIKKVGKDWIVEVARNKYKFRPH
jgi:two-component system alkaline phosphatase synthesis response regulator PhoP